MKIVVIGGSGLIGSKLVSKLREHGHEAASASPDSGVNTLTGERLAEALEGASVVVDVSNSPSFEDAAVMAFFKTSTRNLLAAEAAAGVAHHVALSVVGTERLTESGYFRAKLAQEELIEGSSIPYSIVRATQFYEFIERIAVDATDGDTVRFPPAPTRASPESASAAGFGSSSPPRNALVLILSPHKEAPMSPRLLYLLTAEHAPSRKRDRIDTHAAAARMPGLRSPRWEQVELALAA